MKEIFRDLDLEVSAKIASSYIAGRITPIDSLYLPVALILGTGWADAIELEQETVIPFGDIPGLDGIPKKPNHAHLLKYGLLGEVPVFVLSGRVHMNAMIMHPDIPRKVRLQTEMLLQSPLGVRSFIVTNAAGAADQHSSVGDLIVADGFCSRYARLPLTGSEHVDPECALDYDFMHDALLSAHSAGLNVSVGGYAMLMGPQFESRKYDKPAMARDGVAALGMSTVQEASTIALYENEGARMVAISFISNSDTEEHSDATNKERIKAASEKLKPFLRLLALRVAGRSLQAVR